MANWRKWSNLGGWLIVGGAGALVSLAAWASAPYPHSRQLLGDTAINLLRAPLAERIVIGDSRVAWGEPVGDAVYMGYSSATLRHLERLVGVVCALSDAPVTIALGVNDAKPDTTDLAASMASIDAMIAACGTGRVRLAQAWPVDPSVAPLGKVYQRDVIAAINRALAERAETAGIALIPAPVLVGHTIDGVHFDAATSARYMAILGAP